MHRTLTNITCPAVNRKEIYTLSMSFSIKGGRNNSGATPNYSQDKKHHSTAVSDNGTQRAVENKKQHPSLPCKNEEGAKAGDKNRENTLPKGGTRKKLCTLEKGVKPEETHTPKQNPVQHQGTKNKCFESPVSIQNTTNKKPYSKVVSECVAVAGNKKGERAVPKKSTQGRENSLKTEENKEDLSLRHVQQKGKRNLQEIDQNRNQVPNGLNNIVAPIPQRQQDSFRLISPRKCTYRGKVFVRQEDTAKHFYTLIKDHPNEDWMKGEVVPKEALREYYRDTYKPRYTKVNPGDTIFQFAHIYHVSMQIK